MVILTPIDNLPKKNPCKEFDDDAYDTLKKDVDGVLHSKVLDNIEKQIKKDLEAKKKTPVEVKIEIEIVSDWQSFKKMYNDDQDNKNQIDDAKAKEIFDNNNAYTYNTTKKPPKIKVIFFCKQSLKGKIIDGQASRIFIHELVHSKLLAMIIAGLDYKDLPFNWDNDETWQKGQDPRDGGHPEDHNKEFNKHVNELLTVYKTMNTKTKQIQYTQGDWIKTTVFSAVLALIDIGILQAGLVGQIDITWSVASIGLITFFGMLAISSFHKMKLSSSDTEKYTGTMRQALTGSLVSVYFVVLAMVMFSDKFTKLPLGFDHFSTIITVVIGFYFGSRGALEILKQVKGDKTTKSKKPTAQDQTSDE